MGDKLATSKLDSHLGYWLRFVSNHVSVRFQQSLKSEGASVAEWVALRVLFDQPETTHAELIRALGMSKGAASKVITRLEEKSWARRGFVKGSLREQAIELTQQGKTFVPHLAALADQNDAYFFNHLSQGQKDALMTTLQELVRYHRLKQIPLE